MPMLHSWESLEDKNIEEGIKILKENKVDYEVNIVRNNTDNYMRKIYVALSKGTPYSMKIDEDIYFRAETVDYAIENLETLNDTSNLTLSPLLSTGIPTTDYFIESFLDLEAKQKLSAIFLDTKIEENLWGADYRNLNSLLSGMETWDYTSFYNQVKSLTHYYKGIHPVRVSAVAQDYINEYILKNISQFIREGNKSIRSYDAVYLCNSAFFIKTEEWSKVINDKSLFRDSFDEVPLNLYAQQTGKKHLFIEGSFCIHPYYNTIGAYCADYQERCVNFYNRLKESVSKYYEEV